HQVADDLQHAPPPSDGPRDHLLAAHAGNGRPEHSGAGEIAPISHHRSRLLRERWSGALGVGTRPSETLLAPACVPATQAATPYVSLDCPAAPRAPAGSPHPERPAKVGTPFFP